MTVAPLDAVADSLRQAMHPGQLPRDVSGVYSHLGTVVDMIHTLHSARH